jgi:hypothetical protein
MGEEDTNDRQKEGKTPPAKRRKQNVIIHFLKVENKPHLYCNNYAFILALGMDATIYGLVM